MNPKDQIKKFKSQILKILDINAPISIRLKKIDDIAEFNLEYSGGNTTREVLLNPVVLKSWNAEAVFYILFHELVHYKVFLHYVENKEYEGLQAMFDTFGRGVHQEIAHGALFDHFMELCPVSDSEYFKFKSQVAETGW